ncbi:MAG: alpha/beta fold hydrolase, partial [Caulobacteraceae bacterium]
GPLLVLIHGGEADRSSFAPVLPALAARFTCVAYDQRDTGETKNPPSAYAVADLADDAAALIERLGGRAHVWGGSFGGMIAQELALRHPERVEALVLSVSFQDIRSDLADPTSFQALRERAATDPEARDELTAWFLSPQTVERRPELVKTLQAAMHGRPQEAQARRMQAGQSFSTVGRAGAIAARTLVLGAMDDRVIDPAASWRLAHEIPDAALTLLDRTGHALVFEDPPRVAAAVADHLLRASAS